MDKTEPEDQTRRSEPGSASSTARETNGEPDARTAENKSNKVTNQQGPDEPGVANNQAGFDPSTETGTRNSD